MWIKGHARQWHAVKPCLFKAKLYCVYSPMLNEVMTHFINDFVYNNVYTYLPPHGDRLKAGFFLWAIHSPMGSLVMSETSEIITAKYEGGETRTTESWSRLTMSTCLLSNQDKLWGDLAQTHNRNFFLHSGRRWRGITEGGTVSKRFCWTSRKVAMPVMCCEDRRQVAGLKGTHCTWCVWVRVCTFVCVTSGPKACMSSFFLLTRAALKTEVLLINF